MSHDETIEQAAQVLSTLTTCDGQPHATELHRRQAQTLADRKSTRLNSSHGEQSRMPSSA